MVRSDKLAPHPLVSQEELLPFSAEHTNRIQAERQVQGNAMPRIAVKNADSLRKHPREFSLLYELGGSAEGIDSQVCRSSGPQLDPRCTAVGSTAAVLTTSLSQPKRL
jgi:hypothetical protein